MEDHYVRVHTAVRSELILMRLSDAVARTGREGLQVHRSWWVARDAVTEVIRDGRNLRLKLLNGLEVPVARRGGAPQGLGTGAQLTQARRTTRPVQSQKIQRTCDSPSGGRACWGFRNRVNDSDRGLSLLTGLKLTRWQGSREGRRGFRRILI
uniref:LytTR family transcriptional regulator DNA-binding domain-containing protein n=1 Tax=Phenylobacterium glaciei TaxID=2803784 RepID=A0A974P5D5_9CAUL|nr:LytTR family transcriptional regulator DNA-binding domain-containing protein [Phenylobacterium glaciei]